MRNTTEIKVWMIRNGHTVQGVQRAIGYKTNGPVSSTLSGAKNLRKVLRFLQAAGCPEELLDLPKNMKRTA